MSYSNLTKGTIVRSKYGEGLIEIDRISDTFYVGFKMDDSKKYIFHRRPNVSGQITPMPAIVSFTNIVEVMGTNPTPFTKKL